MDASTKLALGLALPMFVAGCPTVTTDVTDKTDDTGSDTGETDTDTDDGGDSGSTDSGDSGDTGTFVPTCGDDVATPDHLCFTTKDIAVTNPVKNVAAGAWEGDDVDIVYTTPISTRVAYLAGDGDGSFAASVDIDVENGPLVGLQVADMDSGTDPDVTTGSDVYFGDGEGGSTPEPLPNWEGTPVAFHVADIAGSPGGGDLAMCEDSQIAVNITSGNEGEGLITNQTFDSPCNDVAMGPYSATTTGVHFLLSGSEGVLTPTLRTLPMYFGEGEIWRDPTFDTTLEGNASAIAVGDLDDDGDADLAVVVAGDKVNVLFTDAENGFVDQGGKPYASYATGSGPKAIAMGDVDGDGDLDVVVANEEGDSVTVLVNDGTGALTPETVALATDAGPYDVAVGDVNEDGADDIVLATASPEEITVLLTDP